MRKIVCAALALAMALCMVCPALAVDATYKDGRVTVYTDNDGFYEILVDGIFVGKWVGTGRPSNSFEMELEPGEHRVRIYCPDDGSSESNTFIVEGTPKATEKPTQAPSTPKPTAVPTTPAPTAAPATATPTAAPATDKPTADPGADETAQPDDEKTGGHTHTIEIIPGEEATCTKPGLTDGEKCAECGEIVKEQKVIPAKGHRYIVTARDGKNVAYECALCGEKLTAGVNEAVKNRYGNIILNEKGEPADYKAAPDQADGRIMTLKLNKAEKEITLFLENALIMQLIRESFSQVEVVNGKADVTIDLYQIKPAWFSTNERIDCYRFVITGEAQITAQADANGEILTAEAFEGVSVK